jgi:hypothetical protein
MEKRSRRRIRDLVALTAIQGLSQNEIGCARISVTARSKSAPFKGRIQKRKTNYLQIIISSLQRTAGPYTSATTCREQTQPPECVEGDLLDHLVGTGEQRRRHLDANVFAVFMLITSSYLVGACTGRSAASRL